MSLAVFYASALIWAFFCVLAAVVSVAAVAEPVSYRKAAIVGVVVGVIFGVATVCLVKYLGVAGLLFNLLALVQLGGIAPGVISLLFATLADAIAGATAGRFATRDTSRMRRCATVGVAFGLVLGIANAAVAPVWTNAFIPALEAVGIGPLSAVSFGVATMVSGVIIDLALAVIAFRFVRRRWGAPSPATAAGT